MSAPSEPREVPAAPVRRRAEQAGWVMLVGGAVGAVAVLLLDVVLYRMLCQSPPYQYGATRTDICASIGGVVFQGGVNVAILAFIGVALIGGGTCGALTVASTGQRVRRIWLGLSAVVYLVVVVLSAVGSANRDFDFGSTVQFAAIQSAGVLIAWLGVSGLIAILGAQVRRSSDAR